MTIRDVFNLPAELAGGHDPPPDFTEDSTPEGGTYVGLLDDLLMFVRVLKKAVLDESRDEIRAGVTIREVREVVLSLTAVANQVARAKTAMELHSDIAIVRKAVVIALEEVDDEARDRFLVAMDQEVSRELAREA